MVTIELCQTPPDTPATHQAQPGSDSMHCSSPVVLQQYLNHRHKVLNTRAIFP